jgi:hypothetical protein
MDSRLKPDDVIEPSGNAIAAATLSRRGVFGLISSRGGSVVLILTIYGKLELQSGTNKIKNSAYSLPDL